MKKLPIKLPLLRNKWYLPKFLMVMKLTVFIFITSTLNLLAAESYSQAARLNVDFENSSVLQVLSSIEEQSDFYFLYSTKLVDINRRVSVDYKDAPIDDVLVGLFEGTDVDFLVMDKQVVLSKKELLGKTPPADKQQQGRTITGNVTDESGQPLIGVTVLVKGTTIGTITGRDCSYTLNNVPDDAVLVFSYVGMLTQEVPVGAQTTIDVTMAYDAIGIEEVVAIGYGTQRKENVIGSVTTVRAKDLTAAPVSIVSNALSGRLPGATIVQTSGEPGNDAPIIRVRGKSTLNNNNPLIVIDGIPGRDLNSLNPSDIESITVLKDASAGIYGARAANGVILVSTKKGTKDMPAKLSYSFYQGFLSPTKMPELVDAPTYARMIREMQSYRNVDESNMQFSEEDIQKFESEEYPWTHPNTDWYAEVLKNYSSTRNHNIEVQGGTKGTAYHGSFGTQYDDGIYKNSGTSFNRYNLKLNVSTELNEYLSVMLDVNGILEDRMYAATSAEDTWRHLSIEFPTVHARWPNGLPGPMAHGDAHPIVSPTFESGFDESKTYRSNNLLSAVFKVPWIEGLNLSGYYAYDIFSRKRKLFEEPITAYSLDEAGYFAAGNTGKEDGSDFLIAAKHQLQEPRLTNYSFSAKTSTANIKLEYVNTFNEIHNIQAFAAYEQNEYEGESFEAFRRYFLSSQLPYLFAGGDSEKDNDESAEIDAQVNYFGRISYNYNQTYYLQFSFRRDGSLRFSEESGRWGNFPSVLVGYRPSQQEWWQNSLGFINDFKLRFTWGQMGNDRVDPFQYLTSYGFSTGYTLGSSKIYSSSLSQTSVPNPNITWEVSNMYNFGWDAYLFNNKVEFETDLFYERRNNILVKRNLSVPRFTGMSLPDENFGIVDNRGIELLLSYRDNAGDFNYVFSGNFAFARNKIIEYDEPERPVPWQTRTGHPMNSILLYRSLGIYSTTEEVESTPHVSGARPGDIIIEDYDGDNEITSDDLQLFDLSPIPEIIYGFSFALSYKGWQLNGLVQGQARTMAPRFLGTHTAGSGGGYLQYFAEDRWTPENTNASKPRAFERTEEYWREDFETDFNYSDNSFVRLKNLQLSYNIPYSIINRIQLSNARIYLSGQNLFLIYSANEITDPETYDLREYPLMKVMALGAQITF